MMNSQEFEQGIKQTIEKFQLFEANDKIFVAVSGGKDSTVVLYLLKKFGYNVEAITVDAHIGCYTQKNLENIRAFCDEQGIKLHEISFRKEFGASLCYLRDYLKEKGINLRSCTVCGVLRRHLLNKHSRALGATKLVMGHNLDDEAQAMLMNLLKNRVELCGRMGPKTAVINDKLVQRVKPLYFTAEKDVEHYSKLKGFPVKYGICPCSTEGFRFFVKGILNKLEENYPDIKRNIVQYFAGFRQSNDTSPQFCSVCSEPSSGTICRACSILMHFKQPA